MIDKDDYLLYLSCGGIYLSIGVLKDEYLDSLLGGVLPGGILVFGSSGSLEIVGIGGKSGARVALVAFAGTVHLSSVPSM